MTSSLLGVRRVPDDVDEAAGSGEVGGDGGDGGVDEGVEEGFVDFVLEPLPDLVLLALDVGEQVVLGQKPGCRCEDHDEPVSRPLALDGRSLPCLVSLPVP